jgi:hypothetical protein
LLSRNGYKVEDRPVNVAANREQLNKLGFLSVPVVVVAGRAFAGFPQSSLARSLGLAHGRFSAAATRRTFVQALDALDEVAAMLPLLPAKLWDEQAYPLNPDRDHTFGHFAWGVFRFLELVLSAPESGGLAWEELQDSVQLADWRNASQFASFGAVHTYAQPLLRRGRAAAESMSPAQMRQRLSTPWGNLEAHSLLGILAEHTDIKKIHLAERLERAAGLDLPRFA